MWFSTPVLLLDHVEQNLRSVSMLPNYSKPRSTASSLLVLLYIKRVSRCCAGYLFIGLRRFMEKHVWCFFSPWLFGWNTFQSLRNVFPGKQEEEMVACSNTFRPDKSIGTILIWVEFPQIINFLHFCLPGSGMCPDMNAHTACHAWKAAMLAQSERCHFRQHYLDQYY